MAEAMDASEDLPVSREARCRVGDLHLAFVAGKEKVEERAKWRWSANHASPVEAVERSRVLGQELKEHVGRCDRR